MKAINQLLKKSGKQERERAVLLGLVECYIKTGKPVGSNTLKETGFQDLSSATIRNYFSNLEQESFLLQQHISGGRTPTNLAYRYYVDHCQAITDFPETCKEVLQDLNSNETHEIATFLQRGADVLSELTSAAVFLSAPRFDHDVLVDIRILNIDARRSLFVLVTDFGFVRTELFHMEKKLSAFAIHRMEQYFRWRLTGRDQPLNLDPEEELLAQKIYNELIMRFLVNYSNYYEEDVHRTGFSKLLTYPELQNPSILAQSLSLFENGNGLRLILRECTKMNARRTWIGEELGNFSMHAFDCSVIAVPYKINQQTVGSVGILAPVRIPYPEIFAIMEAFADCLTTALTRNLYKFKITYRQPHEEFSQLPQAQGERLLLTQSKKVVGKITQAS